MITVDDLQNAAAVSFKSSSPRLQMYYDLERNLSKSQLSYDKQEKLANQLVELIDRKMKERAPSNIVGEMNNTYETPAKRLESLKIQTGLAITSNIKHDKVPSIPFEPRKEETLEKVGPGSYDPNFDAVHKRLPNLTVIQKNKSNRPVPKKALESFINTIFSSNTVSGAAKSPDLMTNHELSRERSNTALKAKHLRLGKAMFIPKTEQGTPRGKSPIEEEDVDPFHKPTGIFLSKTKRTNLADEKALGPGFYNPHEFSTFGNTKDSAFKKKTDFGNQEGRKFTMHRNMGSPFTDSSYIENPDSWKYQHPEKESAFHKKKMTNQSLDKMSMPVSLSTVAKAVHKNNQPPGPGSYDINFKDELKILDQKLSIRYQLGPFGSTSPRFKEKQKFVPETNNDQHSQQIFNIMKKQEMRKYMDEALNLIKDMQKNKESSIFKSSTDRFREMPKELTEKPKFMIGVGAGGLTDRERELSTMQSVNGGQSTSRISGGPYNPSILKPFDSTSPRFNYKKHETHHQKIPGPGHYTKHYEDVEQLKLEEIKRAGTINKKYIAAIPIEDRQRFSLFGKIVHTENEKQLGPGSYETHALNGVTSKKGFNVSLQKSSKLTTQPSSGLAQGSISTNIKLSPRSSNTGI